MVGALALVNHRQLRGIGQRLVPHWHAFVDMGKGTVSSDEHVAVKLTNGTLTADRLRITEGGDVIRFEGNVVMHLDKLDDPAAAHRDRCAGIALAAAA